MAFDASKLVVGKWYPTRNNHRARFLGRIASEIYPLAFAYEVDSKSEELMAVSEEGVYSVIHPNLNHRDIVRDEPILEPIKTRPHTRFMNAYGGGIVIGGDTIEQARRAAGLNCLGILDLGEEITLLPVSP